MRETKCIPKPPKPAPRPVYRPPPPPPPRPAPVITVSPVMQQTFTPQFSPTMQQQQDSPGAAQAATPVQVAEPKQKAVTEAPDVPKEVEAKAPETPRVTDRVVEKGASPGIPAVAPIPTGSGGALPTYMPGVTEAAYTPESIVEVGPQASPTPVERKNPYLLPMLAAGGLAAFMLMNDRKAPK